MLLNVYIYTSSVDVMLQRGKSKDNKTVQSYSHLKIIQQQLISKDVMYSMLN